MEKNQEQEHCIDCQCDTCCNWREAECNPNHLYAMALLEIISKVQVIRKKVAEQEKKQKKK